MRGFAAALLFSLAWVSPAVGVDRAANILLFIGDGMGMEHVKAARCYKGEPLCFEEWLHFSLVDTSSASYPTATDSAAAGTAIATGTRVYDEVVSLEIPGGSNELQTVLEYFKGKGKRTGLVTTDAMTGATPACFGAHAPSRYDVEAIASNYLFRTRPDVLYGGGGVAPEAALAAGYRVASNTSEMAAIDTATATNVSGHFGEDVLPYEYDGLGDVPHLWEMTSNALAILEHGPNGFFLMVEGGNIDHAAHNIDTPRMVREVLAFDEAVQTALDWATNRTDTLILVTADHETCGLVVTNDNGAGNNPGVEWTAGWHTATPVGCWAWGAGGERVGGFMANTNTYHVLRDASLLVSVGSIASATWTNMTTVWQASSGDVFRVEYTDLIESPDWKPLGVVTAAADSFAISDTNLWPMTNRFYRAVALP